MSHSLDSPGQRNRLLAALPADVYQRLLPSLEAVALDLGDVLYQPNQLIEYVYFPLSGMISIVVVLDDGTFVEAGIVGNEGVVSVPVFLGAEKTPTQALCQIIGETLRMRTEDFRSEIQQNSAWVSIIQRYAQAYLMLLAQNIACNSRHPINQRCARWLLTVSDRAGENQFQLTQEFLSQMLGVRRAGVSVVMATLQKAGYIRYRRGIITIVDRAGLESAACECYGVVTAAYQRTLA